MQFQYKFIAAPGGSSMQGCCSCKSMWKVMQVNQISKVLPKDWCTGAPTFTWEIIHNSNIWLAFKFADTESFWF